MSSSENLVDQIGGPEKTLQLVNALYQRVFEDETLSPFFANTNKERLVRMQYEFVVTALGGPTQYSGSELRAAHAGRGIEASHFSGFVNHFLIVMAEAGVESDVIDKVRAELALYRDKIIGASNVDG